jgi:hypothetical protein
MRFKALSTLEINYFNVLLLFCKLEFLLNQNTGRCWRPRQKLLLRQFLVEFQLKVAAYHGQNSFLARTPTTAFKFAIFVKSML